MRTGVHPRAISLFVAVSLAITLGAPAAIGAAGGGASSAARATSLRFDGGGFGWAAVTSVPAKPTPTAPTGTITSTKPAFKWGAAARAATYEVRVYRGSALVQSKTGLTKRTWTPPKALPRNVALTWKVRARNAKGAGPWSRSLSFKVAPKPLAIGDAYGGGIVAYILGPGDPGYVSGAVHGLIAASEDCATADATWRTGWDTGSSSLLGTTSTTLGTGKANTDAIMAVYGSGTGYAAGLARAYPGGGHTDWYLPSLDELRKLWYPSEAGFGAFSMDKYWSSSEDTASMGWNWSFREGRDFYDPKGQHHRVRAVRSF